MRGSRQAEGATNRSFYDDRATRPGEGEKGGIKKGASNGQKIRDWLTYFARANPIVPEIFPRLYDDPRGRRNFRVAILRVFDCGDFGFRQLPREARRPLKLGIKFSTSSRGQLPPRRGRDKIALGISHRETGRKVRRYFS